MEAPGWSRGNLLHYSDGCLSIEQCSVQEAKGSGLAPTWTRSCELAPEMLQPSQGLVCSSPFTTIPC